MWFLIGVAVGYGIARWGVPNRKAIWDGIQDIAARIPGLNKYIKQ